MSKAKRGITLDDLSPAHRAQALAQIEPGTKDVCQTKPIVDKAMTICRIIPIGKPRMTRRDKWKKRPCVVKYREFADSLRSCMEGVNLTSVGGVSWKCFFPMPKSWSEKKKSVMSGTPHQQKPDRDNIDKTILDSLFNDDSSIYVGSLEKRWDDGLGARIEITISWHKKP